MRFALVIAASAALGIFGGWFEMSRILQDQQIHSQANAICSWTRDGYRVKNYQLKGDTVNAVCVGSTDPLNPTIHIWFKK